MKGGNDTQTTNSAPWEELQPYLTGTPEKQITESYQDGWVTDPETGDLVPNIVEGNTEVIPATSGILPEAQRLYDAGPQSYYPDQTYAGFDPLQTQGQDMALNFATGGMQDAATSALGANQLMTSGDLLYANSNPYLQQNISDANQLIARNFNENVMPAIGQGAQNTGQYGSSRHGIAQGIAARGVGEAMQRNTNQMMNQAYNTGLQAMATGVGQTPTALKSGLAPSQVYQDIGAQNQALSQLGINDAVNAYNFNQQAPWTNLQNYQGALTGNYLGSGGSSTVPVTGSNPFMAGLGGAATTAAFTSNPYAIAGGGVVGLLS